MFRRQSFGDINLKNTLWSSTKVNDNSTIYILSVKLVFRGTYNSRINAIMLKTKTVVFILGLFTRK